MFQGHMGRKNGSIAVRVINKLARESEAQ
jgi:hypothetical protein